MTAGNSAAPARVDSIATRQVDDEDLVLFQKAAASLHRDIQWLEFARLGVSCSVALLGFVAILSGWKTWIIPVVGLVWVLAATGLLAPAIKRRQRLAAVAQEMFDVRLFGLSWSWGIGGDETPAHEVARQARRLPQGNRRQEWIRRGWYENSAFLKHPDDILACQLQNLGWDSRLRQRYAAALAGAVIVWVAAGIGSSLASGATVEELLLSWFLPSAGVLSASLELIARQRSSSRERDRLFNAAMHILDSPLTERVPNRVGNSAPTREIQDGIFLLRSSAPRVPNLLYLIHRRHDQTDFADLIKFIEERVTRRDQTQARA